METYQSLNISVVHFHVLYFIIHLWTTPTVQKLYEITLKSFIELGNLFFLRTSVSKGKLKVTRNLSTLLFLNKVSFLSFKLHICWILVLQTIIFMRAQASDSTMIFCCNEQGNQVIIFCSFSILLLFLLLPLSLFAFFPSNFAPDCFILCLHETINISGVSMKVTILCSKSTIIKYYNKIFITGRTDDLQLYESMMWISIMWKCNQYLNLNDILQIMIWLNGTKDLILITLKAAYQCDNLISWM